MVTAAGDVKSGVLVVALYPPLKFVPEAAAATDASTNALTLCWVGTLVSRSLAKESSSMTHAFALTSVSAFKVIAVPRSEISDSGWVWAVGSRSSVSRVSVPITTSPTAASPAAGTL